MYSSIIAAKETSAGEGLSRPKWQIALAIGAPVALGLVGLWYYNRRKHAPGENDSKTGDQKGKDTVDGVIQAELTPLEKSQVAKSKGNKYFKGGKYDQAIKCYTEAIELCPAGQVQDLATFYQNRAAAYEQLKNFDQVIADCGKALSYNNRYTKAMFRRAKAYEHGAKYMECLEDVTAVCILENFSNQQSLLMADRVLKELGRSKAKETYENRDPVIPSPQFFRTYFSAFANDPIMTKLSEKAKESEPEKYKDEIQEKDSQGDNETLVGKISPYDKAIDCLSRKEYIDVMELCTKEIEMTDSNQIPDALLLRATFYLLQGQGQQAISDLNQLLNTPDLDKRVCSNALIKRGSLKMQNGDQTEALDDFATAVREDPENSDIYHHRGQLNLLIDRVNEAVKDFEKSVQLSPHFSIALVQKAYTEYRSAFAGQSPMQLQSAMKSFEEVLKQVPDCAEGYALYGQALCDQQLFEEADKNFQKALDTEPDNGNIYVHRGLLRLQWQQDMEASSTLIEKALEIDDKCEFAYETLGTLEVQRGNLDKAITMFNKAIKLAKTEIEMAHLYSLLDAAIAQCRVAERLGIRMPAGTL